MNIDFIRLREVLINYFGTAVYLNPLAQMDLIEVENASNEKLLEIAINNGFDLENFKTKEY